MKESVISLINSDFIPLVDSLHRYIDLYHKLKKSHNKEVRKILVKLKILMNKRVRKLKHSDYLILYLAFEKVLGKIELLLQEKFELTAKTYISFLSHSFEEMSVLYKIRKNSSFFIQNVFEQENVSRREKKRIVKHISKNPRMSGVLSKLGFRLGRQATYYAESRNKIKNRLEIILRYFEGNYSMVVYENLVKMVLNRDGDMSFLIAEESHGGNASFYKGHPCVATNFYYDPHDFKIITFGNIQDVSKAIVKKYYKGTFVLALKDYSTDVYKIVNLKLQGSGGKDCSINLNNTINTYNKEFGF